MSVKRASGLILVSESAIYPKVVMKSIVWKKGTQTDFGPVLLYGYVNKIKSFCIRNGIYNDEKEFTYILVPLLFDFDYFGSDNYVGSDSIRELKTEAANRLERYIKGFLRR